MPLLTFVFGPIYRLNYNVHFGAFGCLKAACILLFTEIVRILEQDIIAAYIF